MIFKIFIGFISIYLFLFLLTFLLTFLVKNIKISKKEKIFHKENYKTKQVKKIWNEGLKVWEIED